MAQGENLNALGALYFGGPDMPSRALRDLLQSRIDAAEPGSTIDWCTYYFRDIALARALMRAADRGVAVQLIVENQPRYRTANQEVIALLQAHGLHGGLRLYQTPAPLMGRLHAKVYIFGGSQPVAFVGSFNPSGNIPEDAHVIAEIGDQDRGHNLLLGITDPALIFALRSYIRRMPAYAGVLRSRLSWRHNHRVQSESTKLFFFPRLITHLVEPEIAGLSEGANVKAAISHLKGKKFIETLCAAARRGVQINLIVHDTERRVPTHAVSTMRNAGIQIKRYRHPEKLPMHAKFLLIETLSQRTAWLGSANFNLNSQLFNQEILLRTQDTLVYEGLAERFHQIEQENCLYD